jgi:hypothetical protein
MEGITAAGEVRKMGSEKWITWATNSSGLAASKGENREL